MNPELRELLLTLLVWVALSIPAAYSFHLYTTRRNGKTPTTYAVMEQTIREMSQTVSEMLQSSNETSIRMAELESAQRNSNLLIIQVERELEIWKDYAKRTYARLIELGDPSPPPLPDAKALDARPDTTHIFREIAARFDMSEIDDLAFRIGIKPDELSGDTQTARARALVRMIERRGLLDELLVIAKELRPKGTW